MRPLGDPQSLFRKASGKPTNLKRLCEFAISHDPWETRTPDLKLRKLTFYPTELKGQYTN